MALYDTQHYLKPGFLYFKANGDIYARITCRIMLNTFEYVPSPPEHEIVRVDNNTGGGEDLTVKLRVIRNEPYAPIGNYGSFLVFLFKTNPDLQTSDQVKAKIGGRVYNINLNTYKGGALQSTDGPVTITQNSDIDIE